MHIGNLRVAIFNYLFARSQGGTFLVRIEDTDVERNLEGSTHRLLEDLRWAGIEWDEGPDIGGPFAPYVQSQRGDSYKAPAADLVDRGLAYRCFCSDSELKAARTELPDTLGCPGGCRALASSEADERMRSEPGKMTIRFAVPDGNIEVLDHSRGPIVLKNKDIGDFVIQRSDGRPTYNFAVVVDDSDMEITHVIRGAGHLSNTPKQALLFDALGSPRPVFAHLPTVLAPDGSKLSKRTGSPGIDRLREEGFHPDAVVNYLSLLGWSPGDDREVMLRDELVQALDLDGVGSSDTVYDAEKMRWMSAQHIAKLSSDELGSALEPYIDGERFPLNRGEPALVAEALRSRLHTLGEINQVLPILFPDSETMEAAQDELAETPEPSLVLLGGVRDQLETLEDWSAEAAAATVRQVGQQIGVSGAKLFHPIRLALSGARSGPELAAVLAALGRDRVLQRLVEAEAKISRQS